MPAAAAAAAAHAARKKQEKRRARLEQKAKQKENELDAWFKTYDKSQTGKMARTEIAAVLTAVKREMLSDPNEVVKEELLDKIMAMFDLSNDGQIERSEVLPAIKRYKALLRHDVKLQTLFETHDRDKSGSLSPAQLLTLLRELATEKSLPPPDAETDVQFVIDKCDADSTGNITLEELGPAIATWIEASKEEQASAQKSSACALL